MMQGVLARGTARAIADLSPYVAGKTGTSDDENDAWFVGFTNDVTVAVWIGYDNADGRRRTLGGGCDRRRRGGADLRAGDPGGMGRCRAPDRARAAVARRPSVQLSCKSIDLEFGEARGAGREVITECFRVDGKGRIIDTQTRLVSRDGEYAGRDRDDDEVSRRRLVAAAQQRRLARAVRAVRSPDPVAVAPQWGFQQWGGQWGRW